MEVKKIAIGSDHAGYDLKKVVIAYLKSKGIEVKDYGPYSDDRADYPDYAHPVANDIENKESDLGVLICGSGNGINMTANKHQGIRSALCWREDIAEMARLHNNANIIALPARYIDQEVALKCVAKFISTEFEGGRHEARVNKIRC